MLAFFIAGLALLSIVATYTEVAQMSGKIGTQALRLIPPVLIYLALFLAFTYVPVLLEVSVLCWLGYVLVRSSWTVLQGYLAVRTGSTGQRSAWLRSIRYAPYLLGILLVVYGVTVYLGRVKSPIAPKPEAVPVEPVRVPKSQGEQDDERTWNELERVRP
ncbi:hypothetical protein [Rudanella lutea]|uniref:hypothetical protein n=1 Tax=Rudanella lutea TaxID=451374 RepID=UPI000372A337|nr:hypothetical protein [Rudanella lutea]